MQKWEYLVLSTVDWKKWTENGREIRDNRLVVGTPLLYDYLNELGKQGWELITNLSLGYWVFKRPLQNLR